MSVLGMAIIKAEDLPTIWEVPDALWARISP
jgi:hypothetical protein